MERPSIESFEIKGNKDIKTEDLQKSLRNVGLATGKTFDQSVLEEVKRYLTDQYFSRGKYGVLVETKVEEVPGNKVKVAVDIKEGKRARIRQINIAGNTSFPDEELLEQFELKTPNWLSWYRQDDRYAREALSGDLREAAFVLPRSRLRELRRDLDAGRDRSGEGRHLRHRERERRRGVQGDRRQDRRQPGDSGVRAASPALHTAGRYLLAANDHNVDGSDEAAARRRWLCIRNDRSGAANKRRDEGNLPHIRRGSEESRLRATSQFQRLIGSERRGLPP